MDYEINKIQKLEMRRWKKKVYFLICKKKRALYISAYSFIISTAFILAFYVYIIFSFQMLIKWNCNFVFK